ncbi:MAG: hypothetical protein AAGB15_02980 [Pseudomonadota bacterium]
MAIEEDFQVPSFIATQKSMKVETASGRDDDYADRFDFDFDVQDLGF